MTIQLRRYVLAAGEYDAFVEWWRRDVRPVREGAGFEIVFALGNREANEFTWAVRVPGDEADFLRVEQAYLASKERHAAFDGVPQRIAEYHLSFAEDATS